MSSVPFRRPPLGEIDKPIYMECCMGSTVSTVLQYPSTVRQERWRDSRDLLDYSSTKLTLVSKASSRSQSKERIILAISPTRNR